MEDSKFLCLEYGDRADLAANETDSQERDHSCNTRTITVDGKCLGEVDTFGIHGIQGRLIVEYSEERRPKGGMLPTCYMWGGV